ncbi:hypothetical protein SAMN05216466_107131 [Paraburkholderia phenazinium]|uniref:Uncharacterized protein n=1 Tax=Paraburkholderia phenazinium TaxID=60549 RepID=A0A1G7ZQI0_9BURK|nr:hypothetical protein [Paraburkholderia phenazinium]SDH10919.1 hypothetical protein SAMN05216466_107131 [Paraburkholderia phenazinium]
MSKFELALAIWAFLAVFAVVFNHGGHRRKIEGEQMPHFTDEQLAELETAFGIKRQDSLPVRDGRVTRESMVWWRALTGPECVRADSGTHWHNISQFPHVYQITKPIYKIQYTDES